MKINASARLKIVAAEPTKLFNKLLKVLGKNYRTNRENYDKDKHAKVQRVTWHLGNSRNHTTGLILTYNTVTGKTTIEYFGFNSDVVEATDKDENNAWKKFKKEADEMLGSGDLTPEDRDQLELLLKIK